MSLWDTRHAPVVLAVTTVLLFAALLVVTSNSDSPSIEHGAGSGPGEVQHYHASSGAISSESPSVYFSGPASDSSGIRHSRHLSRLPTQYQVPYYGYHWHLLDMTTATLGAEIVMSIKVVTGKIKVGSLSASVTGVRNVQVTNDKGERFVAHPLVRRGMTNIVFEFPEVIPEGEEATVRVSYEMPNAFCHMSKDDITVFDAVWTDKWRGEVGYGEVTFSLDGFPQDAGSLPTACSHGLSPLTVTPEAASWNSTHFPENKFCLQWSKPLPNNFRLCRDDLTTALMLYLYISAALIVALVVGVSLPICLRGRLGRQWTLLRTLDNMASNDVESNRACPPLRLPACVQELPAPAGLTDDCVICTEPIEEGQRSLKLPCNHWYHYDCSFEWLAVHKQCPLDRSQLE
eukprot:GFYU01001543.1.p1 GENE.GFYU01001543.1~~GFYU01001543.1.p1  ORF type:complete len:402 (-),score=39.67 GFYU01001543.1:508-1713(-)